MKLKHGKICPLRQKIKFADENKTENTRKSEMV
jgi:hypothetical protein